MNILLLPFFVLLSFFTLYIVVKNDFTFLRKDISLKKAFDNAIISFIGFFVMGRILYVFLGIHQELFNPLAFFHILRYPGISFLGGVAGFFAVLLLLIRRKHALFHIFDVYSVCLYPMFLFSLTSERYTGNFLYFNIGLILLSVIFFAIALYSYKNYLLKEGTLALLFVNLASIATIVNEFSSKNGLVVFGLFSILQILAFVLFISCSALILLREGFINTFKK